MGSWLAAPSGLGRKMRILKGFRTKAPGRKSFLDRPLLLALLYPMNIELAAEVSREVIPSMFSAGFRSRCSVGVLAGVMALGFASVSQAQHKDAKGSEGTQTDPLKRPIPEKQRKANAKALKIELSKTYKKWLDEDVRWIITDQEKS